MKLVLVAALALASGCKGGPTVGRNGVTSDDAIVYIQSTTTDAHVYVDGHFVAPLLALGGGVAVVPGTHRFELRHDDYFSAYLELQLAKGERKKVSLQLAQILP